MKRNDIAPMQIKYRKEEKTEGGNESMMKERLPRRKYNPMSIVKFFFPLFPIMTSY